MMGTCNSIFVQMHRMYYPKKEPKSKLWTLGDLMCQIILGGRGSLILVSDDDNGGGYVCVG